MKEHPMLEPTTTTLNPNMEMGRKFFKYFNQYMLLLWRMGFGRWMNVAPKQFGRFLVILHTGRKSGKLYKTPVNYAPIDGEIYCTAGFGSISDWYRNLLAHPEFEIWLPDGRWKVLAEDITDDTAALSILRQVLVNSGFVAPLAGVNPYTLSDDELAEKSRDYRLLHLRRIEAVTDDSRPDDLVWVWPLLGAVLLPVILRRLLRRRQH